VQAVPTPHLYEAQVLGILAMYIYIIIFWKTRVIALAHMHDAFLLVAEAEACSCTTIIVKDGVVGILKEVQRLLGILV
jgi:hypothetical protein